MPRANPATVAFNSGEFSGKLVDRMDFSKYPFAAEVMRNLLPTIEGNMARRPGSRYVAEVSDSSIAARLMPFVFSTTQAYMLELQNQSMRFYRNQGQITVADTDASVSNGTFATDFTDWDDRSTGGASASRTDLQDTTEGTFDQSKHSEQSWGDAAAALRASVGLLFSNTTAGDVSSVTHKTGGTVTASGAVVAKIYTDSSGSPGTQVGGDSDSQTISATNTEYTWTWSSSTPTLSASTNYWVILTNTDGTLDANMEQVVDQGASFASGMHDTITSISDGSGSFDVGTDLRIKIVITASGAADGVMQLVGASGQTSAAEQDITTTNTDQEHVLKFRVRGTIGDEIKLRIGTASEGTDLINDKTVKVGYHAIAFTPTASPFYVGFRHDQAKTIYVDDVSLIDNAALSIDTPYTTAHLFDLKHSQSADVMWITHRTDPVYRLSRTGHTTWSLEQVRFEDGPYLPENETTTTLTPSAATGLGITLTFSSTTGINDDAGLTASDIGRLVRYKKSSSWGYAVITDITNTTEATADVLADFEASPTAQTTWRLGAWSTETGYPSTSTLYEQRLILAATDDNPQTWWASQSADFENMTPDNREGTNDETVEDDDALNFTLGGTEVNAIQWIAGGKDLFIGTIGGEYLVRSSAQNAALTPTDIDVKQHTTHGSSDLQPVRVGHVVLYPQRSKRRIRELVFDDLIQGIKSPDLTILAPHIFPKAGLITQMAFQEEPSRILWAVREDGQLAALTYEREENVTGWSRQIMGGSFSSGDAVVESVAVIPGNDGAGQTYNSEDRDEVWVVVKRTINGATKRYVEFMETGYDGPLRDDYATDAAYETALIADQKNAFYVDSGLTYDGAATTTITGLTHLEGETVAVWADGKELGTETVSSGQITIDESSSFVHVGLAYTHAWKSFKNTAGAARGSPMGQRSRIHKVVMAFKESMSGQVGPNQATLFDITFPAALSGTTKPLFTGELEVDDFDGDWESDPRIFIQDSAPAPMTLTALAPRVTVNEL